MPLVVRTRKLGHIVPARTCGNVVVVAHLDGLAEARGGIAAGAGGADRIRHRSLLTFTGQSKSGKIVRPTRWRRSLFRFPPGYRVLPVAPGARLSAWKRKQRSGDDYDQAPPAPRRSRLRLGQGRRDATQRTFAASSTPALLCPSFRVTHDEMHLTRGRSK